MNTTLDIINKLQFLTEAELSLVDKFICKFNYDCFEKRSKTSSSIMFSVIEEDTRGEELEYEQDLMDFGFESVNGIVNEMNEYDRSNFFEKFNDLNNCVYIFKSLWNEQQCYNCGSFEDHNCCLSCKKNQWKCECRFKCRLTRPVFEKNDYGYVVKIHFEKCGS